MTLKQLEYFIAIAETESVSRAAEVLNVSQPPLSAQLKLLEEELEVKLFIRSKNGMFITQEGRIFYRRATEIINMINSAVSEIKMRRMNRTFSIRIGSISSFSMKSFPKLIYNYKTRHPNIDLIVTEASTPNILTLLDNEEIDIGVVREPFNLARYSTTLLYDEELHSKGIEDCFVAVGKPVFFKGSEKEAEIPLSFLKDIPIVSHQRYISVLEKHCEKSGFTPNLLFRNNSAVTLLKWASMGSGVAVLPYSSSTLNTDRHLMTKIIIEPKVLSRTFLIWKKNKILNEELSSFVSYLTSMQTKPK